MRDVRLFIYDIHGRKKNVGMNKKQILLYHIRKLTLSLTQFYKISL